MKRQYLTYIILSCMLVLVIACSTKKNTGLTRSYHTVTSKYNVLFNGTESYKAGIDALWETYPDDFTNTLPIFVYTNESALSGISSQMDRAIKKATKLIAMHSITVKPKIDTEKELTPKQKEFMSKKEYNKYVDEAYLLMGKAHFHKMEYTQATETFNYVVSRYPGDISVFEARLWLSKIAIHDERLREADDILSSLEKNLEFPKKHFGELYATRADYYYHEEEYSMAIDALIKAIEYSKEKRKRIRYYFVAAQLYAEIDQYDKASDLYGKVIKMNPPYEMTFNAKINRALNYQAGTKARKDIEKQLNRMLRDDKNIEFQDQIYYARGNIYLKDEDVERAIENYQLSLQTSVDNNKQKALTSLTLANLYYERPDYMNAQAYYDSAVSVIEPDYPNYDLISAKSASLNRLVENINIVEFEDSVLLVAEMPKGDLMMMIENMIAEEKRAQEERALLQQQMAEERMERMANEALIAGSEDAGKWYFYNQTMKSSGKKEFIDVWGSRKLEDNWRRSNKSSIGGYEDPDEDEDEDDGEEDGKEETSKVTYVTNKTSPKFYLQYIPFTDSAKAVSNKRIEKSMFIIAEVYGNELQDGPKATEAYEELIKRYPLNKNKLHVYYKLYTIAKEQEDIERVSKYQQMIITEFPMSNFAKLMTNPNYIKELQSQERIIYRQYDQMLQLFYSRQYTNAAQAAKISMETNPNHELYPKFDYIYTVSSGTKSDTLAFVSNLQEYISKYPKTEMADNAKILINYLQSKAPDVIIKQKLEVAKTLYSKNEQEPHYFMFVANGALNFDQLKFNILSFNLEGFDDLRLTIKRVDLNNDEILILVQTFDDAKTAQDYLVQVMVNGQSIFRDVDSQEIEPAVISKSNYPKLIEEGKSESYMIYYKENY